MAASAMLPFTLPTTRLALPYHNESRSATAAFLQDFDSAAIRAYDLQWGLVRKWPAEI